MMFLLPFAAPAPPLLGSISVRSAAVRPSHRATACSRKTTPATTRSIRPNGIQGEEEEYRRGEGLGRRSHGEPGEEEEDWAGERKKKTGFNSRQRHGHGRAGSSEAGYEDDFTGSNRVVGVVWANKRDSGLWFAPPEWKECRLGIQLLPIVPISEALFPDAGFVRDLVKWTAPALARDGVGDGWKGFVYALEGTYDKESALAKTRELASHDDGNTLTNLLWWLHSHGSPGAAGGTTAHGMLLDMLATEPALVSS